MDESVGRGASQAPRRVAVSWASRSGSGSTSSAGCRRANAMASAVASAADSTVKRPVPTSRLAMPIWPSRAVSATSACDGPGSISSMTVPGVITRVTPRRTRPLASLASSSWSITAIRLPAASSLGSWLPRLWWGTPAMAMGCSASLLRLVRATPQMRASSSASARKAS